MINVHEYAAFGRPNRRQVMDSSDEWEPPSAKQEGLSETGSFLFLFMPFGELSKEIFVTGSWRDNRMGGCNSASSFSNSQVSSSSCHWMLTKRSN